ncbi:MAG: glycoside hydrolase family 140 protein [Rariglobus sp.]
MLPRLKVSDNRRFLVTAKGEPFFYLGDTAWELFHRLDREATGLYLEDRAAKGYNVIQAVALAELDGLRVPNAQGDLPLHDLDPRRPNEAYFEHVDWVIEKANALGMYVALLPTWGDKWNQRWGVGPEVFNESNAAQFGEWLGHRYRGRAIIWVVGGDRGPDHEGHVAIIREMARGLRRGDGGSHLITMHPWGGHGSADWFHGVDWLDFNIRQNGHEATWTRYAQIKADYDRVPVVPVFDAEPLYEDHPINASADTHGYSNASDVRRTFYWSVFYGGCGYTYGHHSVWQFWEKNHLPINKPVMAWRDALDQPGAAQMIHGRRLMESRPALTRVPDDDLLVPALSPALIPGAGLYRFAATRDREGRYAMIYVPVGRKFSVRMSMLAGPKVNAWWFDPRTGEASAAGHYENVGEQQFMPPSPGETVDWVLVLDQASQGYDAPGK